MTRKIPPLAVRLSLSNVARFVKKRGLKPTSVGTPCRTSSGRGWLHLPLVGDHATLAIPLFLLLLLSLSACRTEGQVVAPRPDATTRWPLPKAAGKSRRVPAAVREAVPALRTFTNPIVTSRDAADPWLAYRNGYYYFTFTVGKSVEVWKSPSLTALDKGTKVTVWRAPDKGPNAEDVWAPEIHFLDGRWYIYYTASDGNDLHRRQFVLESVTDDPQGAYTEKGRIVVPGTDVYAIDGTVAQLPGGGLYFFWSGRAQDAPGTQNIYVAPMKNPWTLSGNRVLLSEPTFDWERRGWPVNEGPEVLTRGGKTFMIYSASGGTTPDYCLGMLTNTDGNLLRPESWSKSTVPVFRKYSGRDGVVYTPGHNGFCLSPDRTQNWIVYHGKEGIDNTWRGRTARAQQFVWNSEGVPYFGHPVPAGVPLAVPSDDGAGGRAPRAIQGTGLTGEYFAGGAPGEGMPRRTRLDPVIGFQWGGATDAATPGTSVRWHGAVVPRFDDTYTLQTYSEGGVRVWVNGKMLIDDWDEHPLTADEGTVSLAANKPHDLRVEYRAGKNASNIMLAWSSPRQPFEIIPARALFPATRTAGRGVPGGVTVVSRSRWVRGAGRRVVNVKAADK